VSAAAWCHSPVPPYATTNSPEQPVVSSTSKSENLSLSWALVNLQVRYFVKTSSKGQISDWKECSLGGIVLAWAEQMGPKFFEN
jgi:hypothetical protein